MRNYLDVTSSEHWDIYDALGLIFIPIKQHFEMKTRALRGPAAICSPLQSFMKIQCEN
jgi:hypothetical protein